ncbi:hypothetical protein F6455_13260 [Proteobacteria bacterium 005FR1]|nr:hypothetical protein [Proteobacteria bacterium 005FR1]
MSRRDSRLRTPDLRGRVVAPARLDTLITNGGFAAAWRERRIIKQDGERRQVAVITAPDGSQLLLKCIAPSDLGDLIWRIAGRSPLWRTHRSQESLWQAAVCVPESLGVLRWSGDAQRGPWWCQLQSFIADTKTLHAVLADETRYAGDPQPHWDLIEKTVKQLATIHELGRFHGDMKLTNILVSDDKVILVDVDGRRSVRIKRRRQKDLARFLVGLQEVGATRTLLIKACKCYEELTCFANKDFFAGVERLAHNIAHRHVGRYGIDLEPLNLQLD